MTTTQGQETITSTNGKADSQDFKAGKVHARVWSEGEKPQVGNWTVKGGLAQMLKGGVIMDVVTAEHAKIAEDAGAVAVMALERVPADIRRDGGVARMSNPDLIRGIIDTVTIPVMAKCRIGHFVEAQILESLGVDYADESEVLTPADLDNHINKWNFAMPFVCGCRDLGEALRRIGEGAAMIRTKGEAGTGDVVQAVKHGRTVLGQIRKLASMDDGELMAEAKKLGAPYELVVEVARTGKVACRQFRGRWSSHPCGCCSADADRRGRYLRRLRNLQVRRTGKTGRRHRAGHHALPGPRRASQRFVRPG